MSMDIVSRLRCVLKGDKTAQAGADEIERLRAELAASRHELVGAEKSARAQARIIESLQQQRAHLNAQRDQWIEARNTLESERAANATLTEELAASREREARMRDALDHIARVSMGGRTKSKRNEWIAQRAKSALNGDDDWMRLEKPHGYHRALEGAPGAALAEGAQG